MLLGRDLLVLIKVVDYETDALIQTSLHTELRQDVTVITVAHRLQTIMDYDKIVSSLVNTRAPRNGRLYGVCYSWSLMVVGWSSLMRPVRC